VIEKLTMSKKEINRIKIMEKLGAQELRGKEALEILSISEKQNLPNKKVIPSTNIRRANTSTTRKKIKSRIS